MDSHSVCAECGERNAIDAARCVVCDEPLGGLAPKSRHRLDLSAWPAIVRWILIAPASGVVGLIAVAVHTFAATLPPGLDVLATVAVDCGACYLAILAAARIAPSSRRAAAYVVACAAAAAFVVSETESTILFWAGTLSRFPWLAMLENALPLLACALAVIAVDRDSELHDESTTSDSIARFSDTIRWITFVPVAVAAAAAPSLLVALFDLTTAREVHFAVPNAQTFIVGGAILVAVIGAIAPKSKSLVAWIVAGVQIGVSAGIAIEYTYGGVHFGPSFIAVVPWYYYTIVDNIGCAACAAIAASAVSAAERRR